jgi:hypothetical protein
VQEVRAANTRSIEETRVCAFEKKEMSALSILIESALAIVSQAFNLVERFLS